MGDPGRRRAANPRTNGRGRRVCARILYMTTLSLAEARAHLSRLVESAASTRERFDITRNGERAAVLLSADDYDSMRLTIEVLSDPDTMAAIRAHEANPDDTVPWEIVKEELRAQGRL